MGKKKIRLGVIGAGSFSNSHLLGIKYAGNAEAVAICDIMEEKARKQAESLVFLIIILTIKNC